MDRMPFFYSMSVGYPAGPSIPIPYTTPVIPEFALSCLDSIAVSVFVVFVVDFDKY